MNTHITGQSFPGGPDSEKGLWKCVHANDHTWLSKDCSVVFNFICKVHYSGLTKPEFPLNVSSGLSDESLFHIRFRCLPAQRTRQRASQQCIRRLNPPRCHATPKPLKTDGLKTQTTQTRSSATT